MGFIHERPLARHNTTVTFGDFACWESIYSVCPPAFTEVFRVGWTRTIILRSSKAAMIILKPRRANLPDSGRVPRIDRAIRIEMKRAVKLPNRNTLSVFISDIYEMKRPSKLEKSGKFMEQWCFCVPSFSIHVMNLSSSYGETELLSLKALDAVICPPFQEMRIHSSLRHEHSTARSA